MHSISVTSGNITSTGIANSNTYQGHQQASRSRGGFAINRQGQDQVNGQNQAASVDINTDIGGSSADNPIPVWSPSPGHLPAIFASTTQISAHAGDWNNQEQGLDQDAQVYRGGNYCRPRSVYDGQEGRGPLAKNQGDQNQESDQVSDSDVNVKTKIGDPICDPTPQPAPAPVDPEVIVDETESVSNTENGQTQNATQYAEVMPQNVSDRERNLDPAVNTLGQNQSARKRTNARNRTEITVGPGGRHDPLRQGVGPTWITATRTLAAAQSNNAQAQGYDQTAVANSGFAYEYADNDTKSRQTNDSRTNANNGVNVRFRSNTSAPLDIQLADHAAIAEDNNTQSNYGNQTSAASGFANRSRNGASSIQSNGQWVGAGMNLSVDA